MLTRPPRRALWIGALGAALLRSEPARAEAEDVWLRLDVIAHECAEQEATTRAAFTTQLSARLGRTVTLTNEATASLELGLTRELDGRVLGRAAFRGVTGRDQRVVEGRSCGEVVQGIAFIAATWLAAEPPRAPPPEVAPASVLPPRPARPPTEAQRGSLRVTWRTGIGLGVVRRPALDVALALGYATRGLELRAGPRLARAQGADVGERHYLWVTLPVDGCKDLSLARRGGLRDFTIGLCGRVQPGVFYAVVSHTRNVEAKHILGWLDFGPGVRLERAFGKVHLELEGFALVPLTGYRIRSDQATFEGVRTVVAAFGLGAMLPIW